MSVLSSTHLHDALHDPDIRRRLVITPILNEDRQLQGSSIDLRLGTEFLVLTRSEISGINPADREQYERDRKKIAKRFYVPLGETFVLHPRQFVLGSTLEYLCFPTHLMGYVEGRSSWGRLGLVIATATVVGPGYAGVLTFEIANLGEVPVQLTPGSRIAQIVVHRIEPADSEIGAEANEGDAAIEPQGAAARYARRTGIQFRIPTGPELGRLHEDEEWSILRGFKKYPS